nr:hypothetical protein CFP56_03922 [Quercus suber]
MAAYDPPPSPIPHERLTKRDVRRHRIMDRLNQMIDDFNTNQHQHYRAQLQAVQADMTLILNADPYTDLSLESGGDEIRAMVEQLGATLPDDEAARRDYWALAGKKYARFVGEVNDALQLRDSELVALEEHHRDAVAYLRRQTEQKMHQAEEEHKALSSTIRQRLIASISKKRNMLGREKEQFDIADTNSLLFHPAQFSINNPVSPGNGQNRKTRHLRHRATSPSDAADGVKRKRKYGVEEDGNESPAPAYRLPPPPDALGGGRSPFKDARDKSVFQQYEAPAYSIEKLFTEKELALATSTAQQATWRYFNQPPPQDTSANGNDTAAPSIEGDAAEGGEHDGMAPPTEGSAVATPPPAAPEMERTTSQQVLTRGGAKANPLAALNDLAALASAASATTRRDPFMPTAPTHHPAARSEKAGAPAPPPISALDLESDFAMMNRRDSTSSDVEMGGTTTTTHPATTATIASLLDAPDAQSATDMRRHLLDQALGNKSAAPPYRLPLTDLGPALIGKAVERTLQTGFAPALPVLEPRLARARAAAAGPSAMAAALQGRFAVAAAAAAAAGEPMSRTTSLGAASEGLGGASESLAPPPLNTRRGRGRLV